ncbi:lysocardiolipin acyltransferase 1 [Aethina tumida]|uniref:lysocardiolipin acyltransferase 1 n=1 Tax=Aethina tumida TaxID=116153 RepID=UPI00096AF0FA|nr:lysocardiolipin acyltransferase 1 [Aethina tumida]
MFRGWIYCYLWYTSIFAGYALLYCPIVPLLFVSNKLYRYATDVLFTFWQFYPTALLEFLCGCTIQVSGDPIVAGEMSLIVMNHRTRTDWNFLWPTVYHCVQGPGRFMHSTKFVLKEVIRHIPGPGWVMQLACFVYIRRNWRDDLKTFTKYLTYISDLGYKFSLILFPEGTDFTPTTKGNSDRFAEKNGLVKYDYVLHPRTTGFTYIASQLLKTRSLDAVYDVTIIYPDSVPQNEKMLFNGVFPKQVYVHFVRYSSSVLPNDEADLKEFLEKRWSDKERTIKEFKMTGQFLHGQILRNNNKWELYFALVFWTLLPYLALTLFILVPHFRDLVIYHSLAMVLVNFIADGFQMFEIALYNMKKCLYRHGDSQHL